MKKLMLLLGLLAFQVSSTEIGRVTTSGLLFKDSITITAFKDPTLKGVVCHVTAPNRALSFEDQTNTSISCRQAVDKIAGEYKINKKNIFSKSKKPFFKTMTVDRFYDKENNTLVYLAYTKKLSGDNASHSLSTVPMYLNKGN